MHGEVLLFPMGNDAFVSVRTPSRVFSAGTISIDDGRAAVRPAVHLVCGREAVLQMQGLLVELSRRTRQAGAMDWLDHFVSSPDSLKKTPHLLLVGWNSGAGSLPEPGAMTPDDVQGAVVIHEYRFAGRGTNVFATDDDSGAVIAARGSRVAVAESAIHRLMMLGAVTVLISLDGGVEEEMKRSAGWPDYRTAMRTRTVPHHLHLAGTLEETLARLGSHTRRNLRLYRRRAEDDLGAEFVPQVEMDREDFLEMNRRSLNPAAEEMVRWHFGLMERPMRHRQTMFAGVRDRDGRWLSLIGGRRQGETVEIDWQMNLGGLPRYSLSTVTRAFLLEHEIARGTRRLVFRGGTPHPMRLSFASVERTDLLAVRQWSARAWGLRHFSQQLFPPKNFLGAALREAELTWHWNRPSVA